MSWPTVKLGDVATFDRQSVQPEAIRDGQAYLGLEHIETGGTIRDYSRVAAGELQSSKFAFDSRHVLFGKLRPNLAKVARPSFSGICSTDIIPVLPRPGLDRDFLAHFLLRPSTVSWASSRTSGVNLPRLSPALLAGLDIALPPLPEQRRIASILDQADALRANRTRSIRDLKIASEADFDRLILSEDSRLSYPLSDAFWFQEGPGIRNWQFTESGVKLLNVGNITKDGSLDLARTSKYISIEEATGKYAHFLAQEGDFVVASSGISFDSDGLLRTRGATVRADQLPLCMNTSTIRFKPVEGLSTLSFLSGWISSKQFRTQISRLVTGSAQQNFGPSHLKQMRITLPPLDSQIAYREKAVSFSEQRTRMVAHLTKLDELFASLQHRAFRGEL